MRSQLLFVFVVVFDVCFFFVCFLLVLCLLPFVAICCHVLLFVVVSFLLFYHYYSFALLCFFVCFPCYELCYFVYFFAVSTPRHTFICHGQLRWQFGKQRRPLQGLWATKHKPSHCVAALARLRVLGLVRWAIPDLLVMGSCGSSFGKTMSTVGDYTK